MHLKSLLKTNSLLVITLLMSFCAFAQAPNLLNYQGVARNTVGNPLPNQTMKLRLSIHNLLPSGAVVYSEIRQITTNLGGLFSVQIGSAGASSTGSIAGVNWLVGDKFLQVELDPASNNNYLDIGTVQLVSVPYSFAAGSAATVKTNANLTGVVTSVGNTTSISNGAITSDMIGALNKSKVGLDLVNNTSDASKPISTLMQAALDLKLNSTGNAATATKLITARNINGVAFDGSGDITITSTADAGTLTGTTLKSTVTGSSLTSVGTLANLTVTNPIVGSITGNAATATTATTAITSGTATTATKLATARNINGVAFDGSGDITITSTADAGTLSGTTLKSTVTGSSLTSVGTLANLTVTNPIAGSITGNSSTATTAGNITATSNSTITSLPNLVTVGTISSGTISLTTDIQTSGTLTAGTVTYPSAHGTSGQVLSTIGSGTLTWTTVSSGSGGSGVHYLGEAFNGGIIFYLYKGSDGLEHGLIVAPTESIANWQTSPSSFVNAIRTEDGAYNTALMTGSPAVTYIQSLGAGWYLPSIDELGLLYYNRYHAQKGLRDGGHALLSNTSNYWSSMDYDALYAYYFNFNTGAAARGPKINVNSYSVRGVRAF
jgi:hypothetical protein